ncbi:DUF2934 domain-containing protein [Bradyrhizobium arachidis]|uniref:DUF2934 domain-containing protein n=2 Tax=Bradyrhizobium arachidis TaxID=858423 RepID=A0AAE7TKV0_9BRAD|nr:DUF2934 domain-containing protein [Bradyrhizobium arachidis]QOZ71709.1 DUF2934 domain-containing protein [Bradyrhizobium arachidis]
MRARELWEHAGRPVGRDLDFWLEAEREMRGQSEEPSAQKRKSSSAGPCAPASTG